MFLFAILSVSVIIGQDTIPILRERTYDKAYTACPNYEMPYWIEEYNKPYDRIDWEITGGSFFYHGQLVKKIINSLDRNVKVIWDRVSSVNNSIPKGRVSVKVYYGDDVKAKGKNEQEISSLNGVAMGKLWIQNDVVGTELLPDKQEFRILIEPINYPGIKELYGYPYVVNYYECTLPKGWKSGVKEGIFEVSLSGALAFVDVVTDEESEGTVKVRAINKRLHCEDTKDFSNYSQIAFTRKKLLLDTYPSTISITSKLAYNFSVKPWEGKHIYEWKAPAGWSINGSGNTYSGEDAYHVKITPNGCYTKEKVKVRIKSLHPDYWVSFPTSIRVPFIKKPDEIRQYYKSNFSLDIADDKISSVEWSIDDVVVNHKTEKSGTELRFYKSGYVTVSAKLSMKDCDSVSVSNLRVNVKPTLLKVSGPKTLCNQATYTIDNLPKDATVQWRVDNESLKLGSGQGTTKAIFKQNGFYNNTIYADIIIDDETIKTLSHDVSICKPTIEGPQQVCDSASFTLKDLPAGATVSWLDHPDLYLYSGQNNTATVIYHVVEGETGTGSIDSEITHRKRPGSADFWEPDETIDCELPADVGSTHLLFFGTPIEAEIQLNSQTITVSSKPVLGGLKFWIAGGVFSGVLRCGQKADWELKPFQCYPENFEESNEFESSWILEREDGSHVSSGRGGLSIEARCMEGDTEVTRYKLKYRIKGPPSFGKEYHYETAFAVQGYAYIESGPYEYEEDEIISRNGLNSVEKTELILSPNPAVDLLTVELRAKDAVDQTETNQREVSEAQSYEIQLWREAIMVKRLTATSSIVQIPLSGLSKGLYYVLVIKEGETYRQSLIIN